MKLTPEQEALETAKLFRPDDTDHRTQIEQAFMCGAAFGRNQAMQILNSRVAELNEKIKAEYEKTIEQLKGFAAYGFVLAKKKR